jgi:hypothetical protein
MDFDRVTLFPVTSQQTARKFNNRTQISRGSIKSDSYSRAIISVICDLDSAASVTRRGLTFKLQTYVYVYVNALLPKWSGV